MDAFEREWLITWYDKRLHRSNQRVINTVKATALRAYAEITHDEYNSEVRLWELMA